MVWGREAVLAACDTALASAVAGRGRLLLVTGEAGIGKSTVVHALAERGAAAGAQVRWGGCWEGASLLPFGVWLDCLRRPGADACAAVAEQLERGDFEIGTDAAAAERARLRFFSQIIDALHAVSAARPQVVVLEDIHWADASSLQLLRALTARLPTMALLAVATFRDDELPANSLVAGLGGAAERLALEGLDESHVAAVLGDVLGSVPSDGVVRSVHRETGGNPLFITQVGRLLATGSSTVLPTGVRDVLARRLARVSPHCSRVLGVAAVVGTEFDVASSAAVLGIPQDAVSAALDEAAAARLVAPLDYGLGRWTFIHALVRTARYDALAPGEQAELHRRATEVLEAAGAPAGVVAHHASRARFEPGDPRPASLAVAAAREARERLAWDDAAVLCRRALDVAPPGAAGDALRAEAWLGLGDVRLRSGDHVAAAEAFEAAAAAGRQGGRADLLARAALGFGAGLGGFEVRLLDPRQQELLEEAVAALPAESPLRPLVLARLSVALSFVGSQQRRLELADEAVTLSRRLDDRRALAAALAARCDAVAGPDHVADRLAWASEIVALGQRANDLPLELLSRRLRAIALIELRDLDAFDAEVSAFARAADRLGDPLYAWYAPLWRAMRAHADGQLDVAIRLADEARSVGASGGSANAEPMVWVLRLSVATDRQDASAADAELAHLLSGAAPEIAATRALPTMMYVDARFGRVEQARAKLARMGPDVLSRIPRDQQWLSGMCHVMSGSMVAGEDATVRRSYDLLAPYTGLGVLQGVAAVDEGVVARFLAGAASYLGDVDAARRHVDAALAANVGAGRLIMAHTRADCARAMLSSTDAQDLARGRDLASAAGEDYEALGLESLAVAIRALVPVQAAAPVESVFRRDGEYWTIAFEGDVFRMKDGKGLRYLSQLLANPGVEVHALDLVAGAGGRFGDERATTTPALASQDGMKISRLGGVGPALDEQAKAAYRRRLAELDADLAEAQAFNDPERVALLEEERDALISELARALGLGGRDREVASPSERARVNVTRSLRSCLARIEASSPALAAHLAEALRTGTFCAYLPSPASRPAWRF